MLRIRSTGLVAGLLVITGCAWFPTFDDVIPDKQKEYQKSQSLPDLEVPPDLTTESIRDTLAVPDVDASGTASYSTYQERIAQRKKEPEAGSAESPGAAKLGVLVDETLITIDAEPAVVWAGLRSFWKDRGYALDLDDEEGGVLETGWVENRVKQERDRFKVSIEAGEESGTTVLYLSHVGEALTPIGEDREWRKRPRDAGLEERMAAHLIKVLSGEPVAPAEATQKPAADPAPRPKPKIAAPRGVRRGRCARRSVERGRRKSVSAGIQRLRERCGAIPGSRWDRSGPRWKMKTDRAAATPPLFRHRGPETGEGLFIEPGLLAGR